MEWNVQWHLPYYTNDLDHQLKVHIYNAYFSARENPYIVHYSAGIKPWIYTDIELADLWWKYARNNPKYEVFLQNIKTDQSFKSLLQEINRHHLKYKLKKFVYKLKMKFYKNPKKEKYRRKYNQLKQLQKKGKLIKKIK